MKRKTRTEKIRTEKDILEDTISHLKGYALTMKALTSYNPVAVNDIIKELQKMIK